MKYLISNFFGFQAMRFNANIMYMFFLYGEVGIVVPLVVETFKNKWVFSG